MTTTAATDTRLNFGQAEHWRNRAGELVPIDEMEESYRANVVRFLERRASLIVTRAKMSQTIDARISRLGQRPQVVPCVIAEVDGRAIECGATHEWAHGAWHGAGAIPGETGWEEEGDRLWAELTAPIDPVPQDEAWALLRETPLVRRLMASTPTNPTTEQEN